MSRETIMSVGKNTGFTNLWLIDQGFRNHVLLEKLGQVGDLKWEGWGDAGRYPYGC